MNNAKSSDNFNINRIIHKSACRGELVGGELVGGELVMGRNLWLP